MAQEKTNLEPIKMGASSLDELSKNLSATELGVSNESIADQLGKNWKNIAMGIGMAIAAVLAVQAMKEGNLRAKGTASERFEAAQAGYDQFVTEKFSNETLTDEQKTGAVNNLRAFEDNLKALKELDSRSIYASFGELYLAAKDLQAGDLPSAKERLKPFELSQLGSNLVSDKLLIEQALLLKAKVLLSDEASKEEAKTLLRGLATGAKVVAGEALLSYIKVFGADSQLTNQTFEKNPQLREILKPELDALGAS